MSSIQAENFNQENEDLKIEILQKIKSGSYYDENGATICCKYRYGAKIEYDKMTMKDCLEVFFGDIVDDSNCG